MTGLLTVGSGQTWENDLVAALDRPDSGLTVVRRCVDIGDVLAEATTGQAALAVISAGLRRLDSDAVERLRACGVAVVAIFPAGDARAPGRLERIGIPTAVPDDAEVEVLLAAARAALLDRPGPSARGFSDTRAALGPLPAGPHTDPVPVVSSEPGRVVAVWGPTGAPGRSTVAAGLAVAAAETMPVLLMDADVYGGVLASAFGLLDESPGLAGACRSAAGGRLDVPELSRLSWTVGTGLRLLTGIGRADRWPEVRPSALPGVLEVARRAAPLIVVDCGFCLESDEELSFDTLAPRRNGATLTVLDRADLVVVVGSADPPGMERLIRGLGELSPLVPAGRVRIVLNRLRRSAAAEREATAAVARFTGLPVLSCLPEDRVAVDRAWERGRPLAEVAANSALTKRLRGLAAEVVGAVRSGPAGRP